MKKNGFTQIELIVVIFLLIAMIAVDIVVVLYLNLKSGDINVLSDIKQIQSGLDVYLITNNHYPIAEEPVYLNDVYAGTEKLCTEGFQKRTVKCSRDILAPIPNGGLVEGNLYKYQSETGQDYKIEFVLKTNFKAQELSRGKNCAINNQIINQPCF